MKRCVVLMALAGLLLFAVPQSALAQAKPGYSFVEVGYNEIDVDGLGSGSGFSDEGSGGYAAAQFGFLKRFHVFGRYDSNNTDTADADLNRATLGGGWHGMLGEKADLTVDVAWVDQEFDPSGSPGFDDSGYFGRVGASWRPIKLFEVGGWVRYQDVGDFDSGTVVDANAILNLWRIGIGLAAEVESDIETYSAFARFNFGG